MVGDLSARLHVSSDAVDTDFTVALVDVFPDGAANLIQDGILRMGLREPEHGRRLLEPGRVYAVEVDLWAIAYRLPAGHRLRVEISSSQFDRYDRNLNTAALPGRSSEMVVARQTVFHDADRPSHVRIPARPVTRLTASSGWACAGRRRTWPSACRSRRHGAGGRGLGGCAPSGRGRPRPPLRAPRPRHPLEEDELRSINAILTSAPHRGAVAGTVVTSPRLARFF